MESVGTLGPVDLLSPLPTELLCEICGACASLVRFDVASSQSALKIVSARVAYTLGAILHRLPGRKKLLFDARPLS